ncbi:MAG: DNA-processing protein DprA [Clostridiales bacterium]|jgi:DNA processing protein|nr:DNA-processing protein DprA [Clostridiales bacterium]
MELNAEIVYYWMSLASMSVTRQNKLVDITGGVLPLWQNFYKNSSIKNYLGDKFDLLSRFRDCKYLQDKMELYASSGIILISIEHQKYPEKLKHIHEPPNLLFCKGNLELLAKNCVAVVGTRHCTRYGQTVTKRISCDFVDCGVTVVSGLATGIDSYAHSAVLEYNGHTIAVLASGFDNIAPTSNINLAKEIATRGLLLSEYAPHLVAKPFMFVARNRIVAGLSDGIVVVEAGLTSGAKITANLGLEQGKTVYCIPGPVNSPQSIGTNSFIKEGATLVTDGFEVCLDLGFAKIKQKNFKPNVNQLDFFEQNIYDLLLQGVTVFDDLVVALCCQARELSSILTSMEIRGIVVKNPGNVYSIAN